MEYQTLSLTLINQTSSVMSYVPSVRQLKSMDSLISFPLLRLSLLQQEFYCTSCYPSLVLLRLQPCCTLSREVCQSRRRSCPILRRTVSGGRDPFQFVPDLPVEVRPGTTGHPEPNSPVTFNPKGVEKGEDRKRSRGSPCRVLIYLQSREFRRSQPCQPYEISIKTINTLRSILPIVSDTQGILSSYYTWFYSEIINRYSLLFYFKFNF